MLECAPTSTLSVTVMVGKSTTFWKVRATPRRTTRYDGVLSRSFPSSTTRPSSALYRRVTTLKSVVLPAPFGPIRPVIVPSSAANETSSSATIPPNRSVTSSTESKATGR